MIESRLDAVFDDPEDKGASYYKYRDGMFPQDKRGSRK